MIRKSLEFRSNFIGNRNNPFKDVQTGYFEKSELSNKLANVTEYF